MQLVPVVTQTGGVCTARVRDTFGKASQFVVDQSHFGHVVRPALVKELAELTGHKREIRRTKVGAQITDHLVEARTVGVRECRGAIALTLMPQDSFQRPGFHRQFRAVNRVGIYIGLRLFANVGAECRRMRKG